MQNEYRKGKKRMKTVILTKDNFEEEVLKSTKPVIVDFMTGWCGYCKMIAPAVDEIAAEREDIKVGKLNVEEALDIAERYQIMTYPTLALFVNGQEVKRTIAPKNKNQVLQLLSE